MNHIFWDVDKITIMTDVMDATIHRHAMMQFFVCTEGKLDIKVGKEQPDCVMFKLTAKPLGNENFHKGGFWDYPDQTV